MIGVAVIGCGYWGPLHIRTFNSGGRSRVALAVDTNAERRAHIEQAHPDLPVASSVETALGEGVDAVVIATPAGTHAAIASAALRAGKHVLLEKPLTTSSADARALTTLAAERGRVLMVGHTFMYHPVVRALGEMIRSGYLGNIYYVNSARLNLGLHRKDVDVLWDLGAHDVSVLRHLLRSDPVVGAVYGAGFHDPAMAEVAFAELRYPAGELATVHVSWLDPVKTRRMTVVGSRRMAVWDDVEPVHKLRVHDKGIDRAPYYDDFGAWQVAYRYGDVETPDIPWVEPLRAQADHFLDCIGTGATPLTDGADGTAVVTTLEECSKALYIHR